MQSALTLQLMYHQVAVVLSGFGVLSCKLEAYFRSSGTHFFILLRHFTLAALDVLGQTSHAVGIYEAWSL